MFKDLLTEKLSGSQSLNEARDILVALLAERSAVGGKIGYVAGVISSDGPKKIPENIGNLSVYTERVRTNRLDLEIFCCVDVFGQTGLWEKFDRLNYRNDEWINFWRAILESGFVSEIFMSDGWQRSIGAKDEFETAKRVGLKIWDQVPFL